MSPAKASTSKSAKALYQALQGRTTNDIEMKLKGVVEIDSKSSVIDAAEVLWQNNILGAPVYNDTKEEYTGIFNMHDILSAVIAAVKHNTPDEYTEVMVDSLEQLKHVRESGVEVTVSYLSQRNPFHPVTPDTSLEEVCRLLSQSKYTHRVPICNTVSTITENDGGNKSSRCINMISRTSIVKYLSDNVKDDDLNETMEDAGLQYKKDVICVRDDASASAAFELIDSKGLSSIAVIDEDGKLVGNVSASDIKLGALDKGATNAIDTDILSYLAAVRMKQFAPGAGGKDRYPACHVHTGDKMSHVIHLLVKTGFHRVFVADEKLKPVGIVSLADIIRFALQPAM